MNISTAKKGLRSTWRAHLDSAGEVGHHMRCIVRIDFDALCNALLGREGIEHRTLDRSPTPYVCLDLLCVIVFEIWESQQHHTESHAMLNRSTIDSFSSRTAGAR